MGVVIALLARRLSKMRMVLPQLLQLLYKVTFVLHPLLQKFKEDNAQLERLHNKMKTVQ